MTKLAVLLQAHHGKAEFFEKDNNAGKQRQQDRRKTNYEMS